MQLNKSKYYVCQVQYSAIEIVLLYETLLSFFLSSVYHSEGSSLNSHKHPSFSQTTIKSIQVYQRLDSWVLSDINQNTFFCFKEIMVDLTQYAFVSCISLLIRAIT